MKVSKSKLARDREVFGSKQFFESIWRYAYFSPRTQKFLLAWLPLDYKYFTTFFENAMRFGDDCFFVRRLKENVCDYYSIHAFVFELTAELCFQVYPHRLNVMKTRSMCFLAQCCERRLLYVERIDFTVGGNPLGYLHCKKARAATKVRNHKRTVEVARVYQIFKVFKCLHSREALPSLIYLFAQVALGVHPAWRGLARVF